MKKFIKDVFLFLLPIIVFIAAIASFYFTALKIGEFADIDDVIEEQRENHTMLIGLGYNEETKYYKLLNAQHYQSDVIALGTSRVMQFKDEFFDSSFYNCGGAVGGTYKEFLGFMKQLQYHPKCVLLGIDAWVFNEEWNLPYDDYDGNFQKLNRDKKSMLKSIIHDWARGKWAFEDIRNYPDNAGFNGRIKNAGFMYDGSYYYGNVYIDPTELDPNFENTLNRVDNASSLFEWAEHVDYETADQLRELLNYCKTNGIDVIGFTAPYAPTVYGAMVKSGNYHYLSEISPVCKTVFEEYGYEFYDYIDVLKLGMIDENFVDGFHGGDIVYAQILLNMVQQNSNIEQFLDLDRINYCLKNAYSPLTFYKPKTA